MPLAALAISWTPYHVGQAVGMALVVLVAVLMVRRAFERGFGARDKAMAFASVGIACTIVFLGLGKLTGGAEASGPWSTPAGVNLKAGFLGGCERGGTSASACECLFARISSVPPYDTPRGFMTLVRAVKRYRKTQDPRVIPGVVTTAAQICRG
jgi:hypothetical protein